MIGTQDDYSLLEQATKNFPGGAVPRCRTANRIKRREGSYNTVRDRGRIAANEEGAAKISRFVVDVINAKD